MAASLPHPGHPQDAASWRPASPAGLQGWLRRRRYRSRLVAGMLAVILPLMLGFAAILTAKAESAGRRVVRVDPKFTSVYCHACGSLCARPRQDTVVCPNCGEQDADLNGARNIAARAGPGSGQASAA